MNINEKWIQFAYINTKGNINKLPIKLPFPVELNQDQELQIMCVLPQGLENGTEEAIAQKYTFNVELVESKNNHDGTEDITYVIATNNQ